MNKLKRIFPEQSTNTQKEIFVWIPAPTPPSERLSKTQCKSMGIGSSCSSLLPPLPASVLILRLVFENHKSDAEQITD